MKNPNTLKTFALLTFTLFTIASPAHARVGSPEKVRCDLSVLEYKEDIEKLMDINDLLEGSTMKKAGATNSDCHKFEGEVVTCESIVESLGLSVRYHFNTQNGGLELEDTVTGQSTYMSWTNQHHVTKSGYLLGGVWLTNRRGGLLGNKRVFQVEASCWATAWKK